MALDFVYRNQTVSNKVLLFNSKGLPFVATSPASFTVLDFNGATVISGPCVQDTQNPEVWEATFSIPTSAPVSELGEKYRLVYVIKNATETQTAVEYFTVRLDGDPISFDAGRIALKGGTVSDYLITETPASSVHLRILDESDSVYVDVDIDTSNPRRSGAYYVYDKTTDVLANLTPHHNLVPYLAEWTYIDQSGVPGLEVHPIYVVSTKLFMAIDALRKLVDKAKNEDINPNLRYTDLDLAHYVMAGINRVNVTPPSLTRYTTENIPFQMTSLAKDAAAVEALRAQYLAEGVSAFDFQGQSVQLNVDRTQYIQSMIDMLNNDLDERIRKAKKMAIRSSGAGVLGLSVHPGTNYAAMISPRDQMLMIRQRYVSR